MATYKVDIKKQFGKFSGLVWRASDKPAAPLCVDVESAATAADHVVAGVSKAGFREGDEVIFRENAYNSLQELKFVLQRAPY